MLYVIKATIAMNRYNIGIDMVEAKMCSKLYKSFYEKFM